jgi:hypothetical protein
MKEINLHSQNLSVLQVTWNARQIAGRFAEGKTILLMARE